MPPLETDFYRLARSSEGREKTVYLPQSQAMDKPLLGPFQHCLIFEEQGWCDQRRQPTMSHFAQNGIAPASRAPQRRHDDIGIENDSWHIP